MRLPAALLIAAIPALAATLDIAQLPAEDIRKGVALLGDGPNFLWAFESATLPQLFVDGERTGPMKRAKPGAPWTYSGKLKTGTSHNFYYIVDGKRVGGLTDVPAYGPDSFAQPGVPQ